MKKVAYSFFLSVLILAVAKTNAVAQLQPENSAKAYILQDSKPAGTSIKGWENASYPLGNGHFGVSFFGGKEKELWQFTEPSVVVYSYQQKKKSLCVEISSAIELWLEHDHDSKKVPDYTNFNHLNIVLNIVFSKLSAVVKHASPPRTYPRFRG